MDGFQFSWTQEFKKSWEMASKVLPTHAPPHRSSSNNKKNIIRHLLLCIDTSASIEKTDYIPTVRNTLSIALLPFITKFRSTNPLSIISFLTCRDVFEKYSAEFHPAALLNAIGRECFSLLNTLRSAVEILKTSTYNREILLLTASIGTRDSGEYEQILADIKKYNIKVNIISICGEVTLFKRITMLSNGIFAVPQDNFHLDIILDQFTEPLECLESTSSLVKFGFPPLVKKSAVCMCHLRLENSVYECPLCKAYVCTLPCGCPVCSMQLVSAVNISKSLYFMYPMKPFISVETGKCKKCYKEARMVCEDCKSHVCSECEKIMRDELGFCVFCGDPS